MIDRGLFLIKPDAVLLGEEQLFLQEVEKNQLKILQQKELTLTAKQVDKLYAEKQDHLSQFWYDYLTTMPSRAYEVEGESCSEELHRIKMKLRERHELGWFYNGFHAADDMELAKKEIKLIFGAGE